MSIRIVIPSLLQPFTNNLESVEVNGTSVNRCLNNLTKQFPNVEKMLFTQNGELMSYVIIFVNGEDIYPEELTKPVKDEDELHILCMIEGG
ncbi:MoaD/ThiS family protein [Chloroflexota bacterium]